jgi:HEAT repeat protein
MLVAAAVEAAEVRTVVAVAHASAGQPALAVAFDGSGQLHAKVCDAEPCTPDGGEAIAVPAEAAALATSARLRVVRIGEARHGVVVEIPDAAQARTWTAIVLAPASGRGREPLVPFSGYTGPVSGVEGERTGPAVLVRDEGVYVGTVREGYDLCGRPALLSPLAIDPKTLTLRPAKLQRLSDEERERAPSLVARRQSGPAGPELARAAWATSAAPGEPPGALTDGRPETRWAEDRGGTGRGEFAVLIAPREVPLSAFDLVLRPPRDAEAPSGTPTRPSGKEKDHDVAPRELWLATDHELFHVTIPDEAAREDGARWEVSLPAPVHTGCVAVVLESAFSDEPGARVGLAEVAPRAELPTSIPELVAKLSSKAPEAEAAGAMLAALGPEALRAVADAFPGLPEGGRRVALDVLDGATCDVSVPAYVEALAGPFDGQRTHARDAISRCAAATDAIVASFERVPEKSRGALAEELAAVAPEAVVAAVVPRLSTAKSAERRHYRAAISRAAASESAHAPLVAALAGEATDTKARLELLRALGDRLPAFGEAGASAFARLAVPDAAFATRFLLLAPAATLAPHAEAARAFLRESIAHDANPHVRAEAARVVETTNLFAFELEHALGDADVRVRQAAATSLGSARVERAGPALRDRLARDPWPMVRVAAARSLALLGPGTAADDALSEATADPSPEVRRAAFRALGDRRVLSAAPLARERVADGEEVDSVRAAAALSLGLMCDEGAVDLLTTRAVRIAAPLSDETDRAIGRSSLAALGLLAPPDLRKRLAPFFQKDVPAPIRRLADATLEIRPRCVAHAAAPRGS